MPVVKKKKVRKIKYKKVSFKVTEKQKKIIDQYCRMRKTTPTKMMKTAIREHLSRYISSLPEETYISENQLKLFDDDELSDQDAENPDPANPD